jgi:hypothetical protein
MIAIVTSCIKPRQNKEIKSFFSLSERETQTIFTLQKLKDAGFKEIVLVDNSESYNFSKIESAVTNVKILPLVQFQFQNKGINELLMLLAAVDVLPADTPIFKISGRYFPNENFSYQFDDQYDFKFKAYQFYSKRGTISTRGYFVKNKEIYSDFLIKTLGEVFVYPQRIVGIRSLINQITGIFKPKFTSTFGTSIEFAAARVIKNGNYRFNIIDTIGIEGQVAGFKELPAIKE